MRVWPHIVSLEMESDRAVPPREKENKKENGMQLSLARHMRASWIVILVLEQSCARKDLGNITAPRQGTTWTERASIHKKQGNVSHENASLMELWSWVFVGWFSLPRVIMQGEVCVARNADTSGWCISWRNPALPAGPSNSIDLHEGKILCFNWHLKSALL